MEGEHVVCEARPYFHSESASCRVFPAPTTTTLIYSAPKAVPFDRHIRGSFSVRDKRLACHPRGAPRRVASWEQRRQQVGRRKTSEAEESLSQFTRDNNSLVSITMSRVTEHKTKKTPGSEIRG